jgi:lipid-A-disaccharide synthase
MLEAARRIAAQKPVRFKMVVPDETALATARSALSNIPLQIDLQAGGLAEALSSATLAITKTGTITLECAYFGVPAVALYKADWITYFGGRMLVNVKYLSMPNLLAGEAIYPEFIQGQAIAPHIAAAALELLNNPPRLADIQSKLSVVIQTLGGPGAAARAASALVRLMKWG